MLPDPVATISELGSCIWGKEMEGGRKRKGKRRG